MLPPKFMFYVNKSNKSFTTRQIIEIRGYYARYLLIINYNKCSR